MVKELYQARRQRVRDVQPRISRAGWYVVLRGITNVLLRDLNTSLVAEALLRGDPTIYVDLVDYDEIAHHAGPDPAGVAAVARGPGPRARHARARRRRRAARLRDRRALRPRPGARRDLRAARRRDAARHGARAHGRAGRRRRRERHRRGLGTAQRPGQQRAEPLARRRPSSAPTRGAPSSRPRGRPARRGHRRLGQPRARLVPAGAAPADARGLPGALARARRRARGPAGRRGRRRRHARSRGLVAIGPRGLVLLEQDDAEPEGEDPLLPYGPRGRAGPAARGAAPAHGRPAADLDGRRDRGHVHAFEGQVGSHGGIGGAQNHAFLLHPTRWAMDDELREPVGDDEILVGAESVHEQLVRWADARRACGRDPAARAGSGTRARCSTSTGVRLLTDPLLLRHAGLLRRRGARAAARGLAGRRRGAALAPAPRPRRARLAAPARRTSRC